MEYLRRKFEDFLGRQKNTWADPVDEYMGEKDGKELWLLGDVSKEESHERFHSWRPVAGEEEVGRLKESTQKWYSERMGVPYNKKLYEKGVLSEE